MKICKDCEIYCEADAPFCDNCGATSFDYICSRCSTRFEGENCPKCSTQQEPELADASNYVSPSVSVENFLQRPMERVKKKIFVQLMLCIFFGWMGAHRFYNKEYVVGAVFLLTGGLCGLGWLLDCARLLMELIQLNHTLDE